FGSLIFNPQLGFNSTLHDASQTLPSLQIPRNRSHLLSLWNPNPLGAIHGIDYFLRHPNRPVPSICSPPHDMSYYLANFLLLKNVAVALLLEFVGGLDVHQ